MINTQLQQLGLSEKEVAIYLALAETGKSTAHFLCKKTAIARATVYFVLENLGQRGLVSKEQKKSTTFYIANSPSSLVRMIAKERAEVDKKAQLAEQLAKSIAPYFRSAHFSIPKLQFFEGKENVENMLYNNIEAWRDSLQSHDFTWWGYEDKTLPASYKAFFKWYWERSYPREETGEKVRIFSDSPWGAALKELYPNSILRPVPEGYDFNTSIWILGDYIVVLMTRHEPHYAFQIHDPVFSANLKVVFQLLWAKMEDTSA